MAIKDLSLKLAAISLLADQAKRLKDELRAELLDEMNAIGADRVKAELGDEVIAYVTTTKPKFKWQIVSQQSFIKWVKANIPSEIVESVRESSIDAILDKFNYVDELVIDPNGEVVEWLVALFLVSRTIFINGSFSFFFIICSKIRRNFSDA